MTEKIKTQTILGLQSIAQDVSDNVSHPRRLDPTMEVITYSFVLYLQRGCHEVICKPSIVFTVQFFISVLPNQNIILVDFTNEVCNHLSIFPSSYKSFRQKILVTLAAGIILNWSCCHFLES